MSQVCLIHARKIGKCRELGLVDCLPAPGTPIKSGSRVRKTRIRVGARR